MTSSGDLSSSTVVFDPSQLCPTDSINRVRLASAPPPMRDLTAYELLGRSPLTDALGKKAFAGHPPLPAVTDIANRWTTVLTTLLDGSEVDRAARAEWNDDRWSYWGGVRRIVIGGGLAASAIGAAALRVTAAQLSDRVSVEISPFGTAASLVGAARCLVPGDGQLILADFGGTTTKRGMAQVSGGLLERVAELAPIPAVLPDNPSELAETMAAAIVSTADTFAAGRRLNSPTAVSVSIAAYLVGSRPQAPSTFRRLTECSDNIAEYLAELVSNRLQHPVTLVISHDGTAAAASVDAKPNVRTAVLTWGTALGVGYPQPGAPVLLWAPDFEFSNQWTRSG